MVTFVYIIYHRRVKRDNKMLRLGLFLILTPSAFAAPSVTVTQYSENEIGPVKNDGRSSYYTRRAWDLMDGGEVNVNTLTSLNIINDLADSEGRYLAYGQTLAVLGELAPGYAGDACAAASLIQACASGKPSAIRQGLLNYARQLANNIDLIVQLAVNPSGVKYASGSRGGCVGGGRTYDFEDVWNINLASATPDTSSLITEEYCTARRLYSAFNARSNNIGATLTASTTPAAKKVFYLAFDEIFYFLRAIISGTNCQKAGNLAKNAIIRAASRIDM